MNNNGLVIQSLVDKEDFVTHTESENLVENHRYQSYQGIGRYISWPLVQEEDSKSKILTEEANERWFYHYYNENPPKYSLEIVPDLDYCTRYLRVCHDKGMKIRILFCKTNRNFPIWGSSCPENVSIGFDHATSTDFYSTIPDGILLDDSPPLLQTFRRVLNSHGLFDKIEDLNSYIVKRQDTIKSGIPIEDFGDFCIFHLSIITQKLI
jgi:hypothetical protein